MRRHNSEAALESTRRGFIAGAGVAGLAGALAACGGGSDDGGSSAKSGTLGTTSSIPVGGGKVFPDEHVVVTQPTAGQFKAFSSTCTHLGCTVNSVSGGTINCPCHGSKYSIVDAAVQAGPAPRPLPVMKIQVNGGSITLG